MCQTTTHTPGKSAADGAHRPAPDASRPDAIVIGSGFGGAVAAARLAQAGRSVLVLERGRRYRPDDFPRGTNLQDRWLWDLDRGIYEIRWLDRMLSIQAAGWGGGSLVYANVFARPAAAVFTDPRWTDDRSTLDPYYDLAAHMLEVTPITADPATGGVPRRVSAMENAALRLGRAGGTIRPNLAVRFSPEPDTVTTNRYGAAQRGCSFCGECVIGCTRGAKNSLDLTYLALAEQHGAHAITDAEVTRIEPVDDGYQVTWRDHTTDTDLHSTARMVVVAAGAIGTTELLLRQRDVLGTLPNLSPRLGESFSGNGDALTLLRRPKGAPAAQRGPTITTTTVLDVEESGAPVWFQVQDGAIPAPLTELISTALREILPGTRRHPRRRPSTRAGRETIALLLMGRDTSTGKLTLDGRAQARVEWDHRANRRLTRSQARVGRVARQQFGGRAYATPTWSILRTPITVHPLGGAPHGANTREGVIDQFGRVHGYPGLLVLDGAAVPTATGANPSASILALAERGIEHAIRTTGDPNWKAPEWDDVRPTPAPEDDAVDAMARLREQHAGDGIDFRERLTGTVQVHGQARRTTLRLQAELSSWRRFHADPRHHLTVSGVLDVAGIATSQPVHGTLELFPENDIVAMRYSLDSQTDTADPLQLAGHKTTRNLLTAWHALTTLRIEITSANGVGENLHPSRGILHITPMDVIRLVASIRGAAFTRQRRLAVVRRFAQFFTTKTLRASLRRTPL